MIHSNDEEVLTDACWALSYLSDGTNDKIQAVIEAAVCPRLVELLMYVLNYSYTLLETFILQYIFYVFFRHPSPSVLIPALRTVGNIVTGDDMQTQVEFNACCVVEAVFYFVYNMLIEFLWLILQYIIDHQALPCLLNLLTHNHKKSIKKEACWTISNITAGNKVQIQVGLITKNHF